MIDLDGVRDSLVQASNELAEHDCEYHHVTRDTVRLCLKMAIDNIDRNRRRTAAMLALGEMLIAASKSSDEPEWGYDYYLRDYPGFSQALTAALAADADAT